jgi:transposase
MKLRRHIERAQKNNDLRTWKRARAVVQYVEGRLVTEIGPELQIDPSTVARWVTGYAQRGIPALSPTKCPGPMAKLTDEQMIELSQLVEDGPEAAGFQCGIWTGRLVGELIRRRYGVEYNCKYVPELLHKLGFSVQRPRKRLSRADLQAQQLWLRKTFPALKKSQTARSNHPVRG